MGFLRRLFGAGEAAVPSGSGGTPVPPAAPLAGDPALADPALAEPASVDEEERARELELARFDSDRVSELVRRQQRYAQRSWTPPAQGGDRRADDGDATGA